MLNTIRNLISNISDRDRKIIAVLFALVLIFAFYQAIFNSYLPTYRGLVDERDYLEREISNMENMINNNKNIDKQIIEKRSLIEGIVNDFDWQVAKGDPILKLGNKASVLSEKFELTSLVQGSQNRLDSIINVPFELSARGNTGNIQDYLAYVESIDKAISLKRMIIEYDQTLSSQGEGANDIVNLDLYLDTFGATDANQTKQHLASIIGRDDVFVPTVKFDRPDANGTDIGIGDNNSSDDGGEDQKIIRFPRYTFPTRQELGK